MDGIILVAHGSESGNEGIIDLARRVSELTGLPVRLGFKRFGDPKPRRALADMVAEGVDRLAVVPLFMSEGRYASSIPRNLGLDDDSVSVTMDGRTVSVLMSPPIGCVPGIDEAVLSVLEGSGADPRTCGVILLGHGNPESMSPISEFLTEKGYIVTAAADPTSHGLPEAVSDLRVGGVENILVVPMRMTPANIPDLHDDDVSVTAPFGTSDGAARLVASVALGLLHR